MSGWKKDLEALTGQVGLHYMSIAAGSSDPDIVTLVIEPYLLPQGRELVRDVAAAGQARAVDRYLRKLRKLDIVWGQDHLAAAEEYRAFIDDLRAQLS